MRLVAALAIGVAVLVHAPSVARAPLQSLPPGFKSVAPGAPAAPGLVITFARKPSHGDVVVLTVKNASSYAWCLNADSFSASQFQIKIGSRVIGSRAPKVAPIDLACLTFRPGEARLARIDLRPAFTAAELREGALCYTFAYRRDPSPQKGARVLLGEIGTICEGREGTGYLAPTE